MRPDLDDWKTYEELSDLQDEQLGTALDRAARSPFYRDRLARTDGGARTRLGQLETTGKQDLRDNYPFGMLAVPSGQLATYHESSGTAGRPTPSYYTAEDWEDLAERFARKYVGILESDVLLVRTPYALLLTGHLAHAAGRLRGATVVPGDNRSLAMPYSRVVRVLHDLGVTLSWSVPTECLLWAAAARAAGQEPGADFPALRALFVGGEPLTPARKARIAQLWGVPVVEEYGSTETGSLAGECPAGRLHLWSDRAIFEVKDPGTNRISAEGDGQLVVTTLYRQAMPLLRYDLEDNVRVAYQACDCGWVLPTVEVLGRSAFGYAVGSEGRTVTQHALESAVFGLPEPLGVLFYRARAERDVLRIELETASENQAEACVALRDAVSEQLGVPSEVEARDPGSLVPAEVLTGVHDVVKPRSLFGPDEHWDKALLYY